MKPEQKARQNIDKMLIAAGWKVQDTDQLNLGASLGIAIREFRLPAGPTDYGLFVNRKLVGVIEAKPAGTTLSGVAEQSQSYLGGLQVDLPYLEQQPPFAYETTGIETFFRDLRDPDPRSRRVFGFHKPETIQEWFSRPDTLRARLTKLQTISLLSENGLWNCQIEAIRNLELSLAYNRPRALIQMATGSGKTYTAVSFIYRLIKFADAKRILFLVDRGNLGRQTRQEFEQYVTPDDGRKFIELYNVQHMTTNILDPINRVVITTIQRLYSILQGKEEYEEENEEISLFDMSSSILDQEKPKEVYYRPECPIETFDFIITDECHRSIYHLWRQVLEYFDAFIIGLTATPSKQTLGFFHSNLVMEYKYDRAIADGVNVDYNVYRIRTQVTEKGSRVEAGNWVDKRSRFTRKVRWEQLDDDLEYKAKQLDRSVVAKDQIRTIIKTFNDKLFTEIFPGRKEVPKTLIFAKDDSHAEDIVEIVREEFGRGNDFCKKITYRTKGEKPDELIKSFRISYNPRIAVTVDMISTGTDIKPLECLIFMRDVKSRLYFEQMKGRGTRIISSTDFNSVTPDAKNKTHFVIVDAVGVCETDKTESHSLERKKSVPFDKLLNYLAIDKRDEDTLTSLAGRLALLDRELEVKDRKEIETASNGRPFKELVNNLFDAFDPDKKIEKAKEIFKTETPTEEHINKATAELVKIACEPFDNPKLRNTLIDIEKRSEQTIDEITIDRLILADYDASAKEKSMKIVETFKKFIEDNKDELTALQIIYSLPYGRRHLTYEEIKELAEAIKKPPYQLSSDLVWKAYEQLEMSKVRGVGPTKLLTDIISLIRFTMGKSDIIESFSETVSKRFEEWISKQERLGKKFTSVQIDWLVMIKDHIATSLSIALDDFELSPFYEKGGPVKVYQLFGSEVNNILEELNEVLVAALIENQLETIKNQSELPTGWTLAKLGELFSVSKEKFNPIKSNNEIFIGLEHIEPHTGKIIVTGRSSEIRSTKTVFHSEDILYGRLRPYLNKVCVPNFNGVCSTDIIVFTKNDFLDTKYIAKYLSTGRFVRFASQNMSGVQHPRISHDVISQYFIPLPPLQEQHRIVSKLDELFTKLDAGIDVLKRTKVLLKHYRQSILKYAFEGKLTEKWRENNSAIESASDLLERIRQNRRKRYEEHERVLRKGRSKSWKVERQGMYQTTVPKSWELVLSSELVSLVTSGSRGWAKYYSEKGSIFIRINNLDHGTIYPDFTKIQRVMPPENTEGIRTRVQPNDLLVSITADVGMIALIPESISDAYVSQHIALVRVEEECNARYIAWYLSSYEGGLKQFRRLQRGMTKVGLGLDDIKSIWIPIPPMIEQHEIVNEIERIFSIVHNTEMIVEQGLRQGERLHQSILRFGFEGKLVPQDPTDEPATILLKRIREKETKHEMVEKKVAKSLKIKIDSEQTRLV